MTLHSVTSANALHFIYGASGDDTTPQKARACFEPAAGCRYSAASLADGVKIDALAAKPTEATGDDAVGELFTYGGQEPDRGGFAGHGILSATKAPPRRFSPPPAA